MASSLNVLTNINRETTAFDAGLLCISDDNQRLASLRSYNLKLNMKGLNLIKITCRYVVNDTLFCQWKYRDARKTTVNSGALWFASKQKQRSWM